MVERHPVMKLPRIAPAVVCAPSVVVYRPCKKSSGHDWSEAMGFLPGEIGVQVAACLDWKNAGACVRRIERML